MRTVFILGAGASIPYKFPSGYQLVSEIISILQTKQSYFLDWGYSQSDVDDFRRSLEYSKPYAIDDLLIQRKEFLQLGKYAIALTLAGYESPNVIKNRDHAIDWYGYFFEHLRKLPGSLSVNQFAFITFNYDRSLEYFLDMAAEAYYGTSNDDKKLSIISIPILHIHGNFGLLPSRGGKISYIDDINRPRVELMANNLKLIEEESDKESIEAAQELLRNADRIRFLGFGFHQNNMEKIRFKESVSARCEVSGTAVGFSEAELLKIIKQYPRLNSLDRRGRSIIPFFRESHPLD